MQKHNGWSNVFTWQLYNWMSSDARMYGLFSDEAKEVNAPQLADQIKEFYENDNPFAAANPSVFTDLMEHALALVNWDEIARSFYE
jgi:rubrerythrin